MTYSAFSQVIRDVRAKLGSTIRLRNRLVQEALGEFVGTFILVAIGDGSIAQVELGSFNSHQHGNFTSIVVGWGIAVMMGVFFAARSGRGLINPAVAVAFSLIGMFGPLELLVCCVAEVLGGFAGAALVYSVYSEHIYRHAEEHSGGRLTINTTGGLFCTWPTVSHAQAFYDQVVGTALLCGGALAIVDENNLGVPAWAHAPCIGVLVTGLVAAFALNAGAALNPARDLGPRLFIAAAGWGSAAFTGHNYYFWVPLLGPVVGATVGALLYQLLIGNHLDQAPDPALPVVQPKQQVE